MGGRASPCRDNIRSLSFRGSCVLERSPFHDEVRIYLVRDENGSRRDILRDRCGEEPKGVENFPTAAGPVKNRPRAIVFVWLLVVPRVVSPPPEASGGRGRAEHRRQRHFGTKFS